MASLKTIKIALAIALFASCDGSSYRVTIEYEPSEDCYGCWEEEKTYDPDLVDPFSKDTNWRIDELGNIVWLH